MIGCLRSLAKNHYPSVRSVASLRSGVAPLNGIHRHLWVRFGGTIGEIEHLLGGDRHMCVCAR